MPQIDCIIKPAFLRSFKRNDDVRGGVTSSLTISLSRDVTALLPKGGCLRLRFESRSN